MIARIKQGAEGKKIELVQVLWWGFFGYPVSLKHIL